MTHICTTNKIHYADMSTLMNIYSNIQQNSPLMYKCSNQIWRETFPTFFLSNLFSLFGHWTQYKSNFIEKRKKDGEKR